MYNITEAFGSSIVCSAGLYAPVDLSIEHVVLCLIKGLFVRNITLQLF